MALKFKNIGFCLMACFANCWGNAVAAPPASKPAFRFSNAGEAAGLFPHVAEIRGHAAAWGDINDDGWPDLFVGTFHNAGSKASLLMRNERGRFQPVAETPAAASGIGSGALFADLTNNGRLDLYISHCAHGQEGVTAAPSVLLRNDGGGQFTNFSAESGACPPSYHGRGVAALDYNGDGLLDLLMCERYYGAVKTGPALYRNLGEYRFENVAERVGLPKAFSGLGVAAADMNQDGWPDIFLTSGEGQHRLYLNNGRGEFEEAAGSRSTFQWTIKNAEDTPAGVCVADVNRDGLPDILIGQHFKAPWREPAGLRLYLHQGVKAGTPTYQDVSAAAGLLPLAMKAPHVEIQDFDNDGWPDLYASVVKFEGTAPHPLIYRHQGAQAGGPRFEENVWAVNDFPTSADLETKRTGDFFKKLLADKKITYMAAAPSCDYDRDGRLDLFLASWWLEERSLLLHNETPGGHFLDVTVTGARGVNRQGIGSLVTIYTPGGLGNAAKRLGSCEIRAGYGYCSGQEAAVHFGLGSVTAVDVEVILPHGRGRVVAKNVAANQRFHVKQ